MEGAAALYSVSQFKRGTFFKQGRGKDAPLPRPPSRPSPPYRVTVASVHFVSQFLALYLWPRPFGSCFHSNRGAGLPLFNLFERRAVIISVPR